MAMLEGVAKGGPRDGVKLSCPSSWDGRIMKKQQGPTYHNGYYTWDPAVDTWVWQDGKEPPKSSFEKFPAGRPITTLRKRQPFAGYQYRTD